MFAAFGRSLAASAVTFVSKAAATGDLARQLGLARPLVAVANT
jgi:urease subunit alpha